MRYKGEWLQDREYRKAADGTYWVNVIYVNDKYTANDAEEPYIAMEGSMLNWVKLKKYYELSGDTQNSFHHKKSKGLWREGKEFRKAADGVIWVNLNAVNEFAEKSTYIPKH